MVKTFTDLDYYGVAPASCGRMLCCLVVPFEYHYLLSQGMNLKHGRPSDSVYHQLSGLTEGPVKHCAQMLGST